MLIRCAYAGAGAAVDHATCAHELSVPASVGAYVRKRVRPTFNTSSQLHTPNTVLFKMVRPSRVTEQVDVDEIGQLSLVTPRMDE